MAKRRSADWWLAEGRRKRRAAAAAPTIDRPDLAAPGKHAIPPLKASAASREAFVSCASETAQHLQIFVVQRCGDAPLEHLREARILAQHREQMEAPRTWILQIVDGILRHHHKIPPVGRDRALSQVKDHLSTQHDVELFSVVMGVQQPLLQGVMNFTQMVRGVVEGPASSRRSASRGDDSKARRQ